MDQGRGLKRVIRALFVHALLGNFAKLAVYKVQERGRIGGGRVQLKSEIVSMCVCHVWPVYRHRAVGFARWPAATSVIALAPGGMTLAGLLSKARGRRSRAPLCRPSEAR